MAAAVDGFKGKSTQGSITGAVAVVPSDTVDLPNVTRKLYVSVAGALKVTMRDGTAVVFATMIAGWHDIRVSRVWATGTAATGIVAGW